METGTNGPIDFVPGPGLYGGYWFDDVNNVNTQDVITFPNSCTGAVSAVAPGCVGFTYTPLSPARGTSTKGIHITCTLVTQYAGCEVAFEFAQQNQADASAPTLADGGVGPTPRQTVQYDISKYSGLDFWVLQGSQQSAGVPLLVKVPNKDTDPRGGVCTTCYDDFASTIAATATWQELQFPFALMEQGAWGVPQATTLDLTTVYGVNFSAKGPQEGPDAGGTPLTADYWIDDVSFTQ
jgi:hypothetical protein